MLKGYMNYWDYGLTLTWDVFKYELKTNILFNSFWLTLTWDVFKLYSLVAIAVIKLININMRCI